MVSGDTVPGRFAEVTLDGSLSEWQGGDVFYSDADISDGAPLNSTYSSISIVNDATYLYFGLQLKAPSSIFSNWTHTVYLDTDENSGTGFNAGWMAGGYDRLIQYGAGGGVYSVYSFTGGTQGEWSWNFLGTFNYAYNEERIEWAIPRSMLGGAVAPRILFNTSGGDVSVDTWAYHSESGARNYEMAETPEFTFQVHTGPGSGVPSAGSYQYPYGTELSPGVTAPSPANGTQVVSLGWAMTGHNPVSGSDASFNMTITNNAVLHWLWQTNVFFTRSAGSNGSVGTEPASAYYPIQSSLTVTAAPDPGYVFAGWSGDVSGAQTNDNPLTLTLNRTRSITANFAVDYGRFTTINMDGSLAEWQSGDVLYEDSEIIDGAPDNSTYSEISVANDHEYLYVGLQLKAASTIFSDWLHSAYIDSDMNPATGFNAGWMGGGYDLLVQYGGGGGTYSIYAFTGPNQATWGWEFISLINYAYDGDTIEWAIPRSALGGSTAARMKFQSGSGSVTVETWAHHTDAQVKVYTFAPTPNYTVTVASAHGTPDPSVGPHVYAYGTGLTNHVTEPAAANGTQYVSLGWSMTGHDPISGSATSLTMTVTNSGTLTWLWQTNVQLTRSESGPGGVTGDSDGYYNLGSSVNLTATPDAGYRFAGWSGDVPAGQTNENPLTLTMDRKRNVTANFSGFNGRFLQTTMDGMLTEWVADDVFYDDPEIVDGAPLNSTYEKIYVANDHEYLYVGMKLKGASTIFSDWIHNLFIDIDVDGNTGYDPGWMNGGYDRLVQYGASGGSYSILSFGGAGQGEWSWNFEQLLGYAYNNDEIEWSIPRSALGGSTSIKLTFLTEGGSVTVVTWAHHTEAQARVYTLSGTPTYTVTVASARGTPNPSVGAHTYSYGAGRTNHVTEPAPANGTQYVNVGWTMTGHSPVAGVETSLTMTVTNNATLTWLWNTNVQFTRAAGDNGAITGAENDYYAINDVVNVTAVPDGGYLFKGWSGHVPAGQTNDNPLALTLDQARSITANFGPHQGEYQAPTIDGVLTDWSGVDAFYVDADISDGLPLNSSCSSIFIMNDLANLYIGLQFKADSSINSNWVYNLFIDSDLNPATGFNGSGNWMANGYDRLIQYGANGSVYSVYSFSGGSQGDWSWSFVGLINYAFNGSTAEWGIPLASLNISGSACKLLFQATEGAVTFGGVETWAHHTEGEARIYSLGTPPPQSLQVNSSYGTAQPAVGSHMYAYGTEINCLVTTPSAANGTQVVVAGWAMTGNDPVSGAGNSFTMNLTNTASLTWLWTTNVQFTRTAGANGVISGDDSGYYARNAQVTVTAVPDGGYSFDSWSGDVPGGQESDNPLILTLDRARSVTANFSQNVGRYEAVTPDGNLGEWEGGDVFYADAEIIDGLPLNSTYSSISVVNDNDNLYVGMQLKGPSSITSNWVHELYIDSDMNPNTGFDAGWMTGGYDRLVQYGSGGTVYSIYSFTGGSQSEWSWNFLGTINYGFNENVIEWSIPRSYLGAATVMRLEFRVGSGGVSVETWAHHTESEAKAYAFATPNNCASGIRPLIVRTADQTVEANQPLSFTVRASDPGCIPPEISIIGKPAAATFGTSPSGTNQVGTFTWTPSMGDVDTHLLRFVAEDDQGYSTSFVMRVYVAAPGEDTNESGVPLSQTNWAVSIADVQVPSSGSVTVMWEAVSGIEYDIYKSTDAFGSGMNWTRITNAHEADGGMEDAAMNLSGSRNFLQVVPAGAAPSMNGVWGVIKPTVTPSGGITLVSPPLQTDLNLQGGLGAQMAQSLTAGSKIMAMSPGANPTWSEFTLNGEGEWIRTSGAGSYTLNEGQGFFLQTAGSETSVAISGEVGNKQEATNTLMVGYNLIGISHGKVLAASTAFNNANPIGNANNDETLSDQVIVQRPDGSWRRLIRRSNNTWYDTDHPNSTGETSLQLTPGQAYYYIRRNSNTTLSF